MTHPLGRFRLWRELGGGVREIGGAIRGQTEVLGRFRAELEDRLRWERVSLGKAHSEAVRGIESKAGEFYREGLDGSEKRARAGARSDGLLLSYGSRPVDWYRINELKHSVLEEQLEQVREIDGEQAYEKMRRAVEKASQEKASQEKASQEKASQEKASQEKARQVERARQVESRPERRGPERGGGRSGTLAPAASLVLLRGRGRMDRTDWEEAWRTWKACSKAYGKPPAGGPRPAKGCRYPALGKRQNISN